MRGNNWVFPGRGKSGHVTDYKKRWKEAITAAGLDYPGQPELRLRIHDLRRTLPSYMVAGGTSMAIAAKVLGHSNTGMTEKSYATVQLDAARAAMEPVTRLLASYKPKSPRLKLLPAAPKQKAARRG